MKSRNFSGILWRLIISAIIIFGLFYLELPPLNLRSESFWSFLFQCVIIVLVINGFGVMKDIISTVHTDGVHGLGGLSLRNISKPFLMGAVLLVFIIVIQFLGSIVGHPFFHSGAYSRLINVEDGDFSTDVAELSMNQIPVVDKDSAQRLGNRKLGEMSDLVSQFEIMDM